MQCPSCGLELPEESKFCNSCGSSVSGEMEEDLKEDESNKITSSGVNNSLLKNKKAFSIVILGLIVLISISFYYLFLSESEEERIAVMAAQDLKEVIIFPETLDFYEILVIYHTTDDEDGEYEEGDIDGVYLDYVAETRAGGRNREEIFYSYEQESGTVNFDKATSRFDIEDREKRELQESLDEISIGFTYDSAKRNEAYVEFESDYILNQLE